jgi:hypothetical protein
MLVAGAGDGRESDEIPDRAALEAVVALREDPVSRLRTAADRAVVLLTAVGS